MSSKIQDILNYNQINRIKLIQVNRTSNDPKIDYKSNKLQLSPESNSIWTYLSILVFFFLPILYIIFNPSIILTICFFTWDVFLTYIYLDSSRAINIIEIELKERKISVIPTDTISISMGFVRASELSFIEIENVIIISKYTASIKNPLRKRISLQLFNGKEIALIDFCDSINAERFANLLGEILQVRVSSK